MPATFTTVMSGLDNPRGLAFGPEGALYVAEAGRGGDGPSIEIRPGVFAFYGPSGAVSRLWHGHQERVATGLPSLIAPDGATGPHDISFQGLGNGYVTIGLGTNPTRRFELGAVGVDFAQLIQLQPSGNWQNSSDIGAHEAAVNPGGGSLDTNPFGVLAEAGSQVVVDAGGNALLRVAANGDVTTMAEFPSRDDGRATDAVPTCVVRGPDGAYYVGELTGLPFAAGAANIYRVVPGQAPEVVHAGFKTIIDMDFGPDGSLYVLQHATGAFFSGPGVLIRIAPDGTRTPIEAEGLTLNRPTSVLVDDDGTIYVSNRGISVGTGEVLRITLAPATATAAPSLLDMGPRALSASSTDSDGALVAPSSIPRPVTVDIVKGFGDFTPGTFTATGGVTDAGVYQLLDAHDAALPSPVVGTGHDTFALTGTRGTITMKSETVFRVVSFDPLIFGQDGHWRIVSGTGDYADLKGEGEYHKLIDVALGQISIELTGLVHSKPVAPGGHGLDLRRVAPSPADSADVTLTLTVDLATESRTWTAAGAIEDSGTAATVWIQFGAFGAPTKSVLLIDTLFTNADGTGTFTIRRTIISTANGPDLWVREGTWHIVDATGVYAGLRGQGKLTGVESGTEIVDTLTGTLATIG